MASKFSKMKQNQEGKRKVPKKKNPKIQQDRKVTKWEIELSDNNLLKLVEDMYKEGV
jgi:hypothetical protein